MSEKLHRDSIRALESVRSSLSFLLKGIKPAIKRPTDLQRVLGLRVSLAWQIVRVAHGEDPSEFVVHVPLQDAMAKFLDACETARLNPAAIARVREAYARLIEVVEQHAGDRATFDAMIGGAAQSGKAESAVDLRSRRAAFRATSQCWGVRCALSYRCMVASLADEGTKPLAAIVQGVVRGRVLKVGRPLPVCRRTVTVTSPLIGPGEAVPERYESSRLEDFCSDDLPDVRTVVRGSVAHDYLVLPGAGLSSEVDAFFLTKLGFGLEPQDPTIGLSSMIRLPTEEFVADLLVPAGVVDVKTALCRTLGCLEDVSAAETARPEYALHADRPATYLGQSIDALMDESLPRCPELVRYVLRELGVSRSKFDIFRCRVSYPLLHTCIALDAFRPK